MVDFFLKGFTYFIFIFIDSYVYLRIFLREKLFYKPLIELSNFRKYFVTINNEDHSVWEIGNKDAVKEKTLILIGGIPTDPLKSMSWLADCLNRIDNSLRIIIFNMPYYEDHFMINLADSLAISNGESLTTKKTIDFSKLKVDPKFSHINQSKTIKLLMDEMGIDSAHLIGHDRGAVILENLCIIYPYKALSYSRGSQVWNHYKPEWKKLAPDVLVGTPHSIMSSYHQLRILLFAVIFLNKPIQLLSEAFVSKGKKAKNGTHLFDRYTHLKLSSQVSYKSYFNKFKWYGRGDGEFCIKHPKRALGMLFHLIVRYPVLYSIRAALSGQFTAIPYVIFQGFTRVTFLFVRLIKLRFGVGLK